MPVPTSQTGAAGEFYAAAQLSQRGWAACVLVGNVPRTDILAQHAETGTTISVQSKAANGGGLSGRRQGRDPEQGRTVGVVHLRGAKLARYSTGLLRRAPQRHRSLCVVQPSGLDQRAGAGWQTTPGQQHAQTSRD